MRVMLDTHTFIWYVTNNSKLGVTTKVIIDDGNNEAFLSIASIWEMAVKQSIGKLSFGLPFRMFIEQQLSLNRIELLNINLAHIDIIASLPLHHRDPFDRLIIAQAMVENIPILSADVIFDSYPIQRWW